MFFSSNIAAGVAYALSSTVDIPVTDDFANYLGMPLLLKPVSQHTVSFLVDKVRKNLSSRKGKLLSIASRWC